MAGYFHNRIQAGESVPGLFILPKQPSAIGQIIDCLLLVWAASNAEEGRDRIVYLPFR